MISYYIMLYVIKGHVKNLSNLYVLYDQFMIIIRFLRILGNYYVKLINFMPSYKPYVRANFELHADIC